MKECLWLVKVIAFTVSIRSFFLCFLLRVVRCITAHASFLCLLRFIQISGDYYHLSLVRYR